jgi:hypothetical protein
MGRSTAAIAVASLVAAIAYLFNFTSLFNSNWEPFVDTSTLQHNKPPQIATIESTLGPQLSSKAQIHLPDSAGFNTSTDRWNNYITPTFAVVVEVATEADVQATIWWANNATLPFLAVTGGHGVVQSLSSFRGGVGIWMRGMKDVEILEGGEKARIEGGILSGELVHELWQRGKMTGKCLEVAVFEQADGQDWASRLQGVTLADGRRQ